MNNHCRMRGFNLFLAALFTCEVLYLIVGFWSFGVNTRLQVPVPIDNSPFKKSLSCQRFPDKIEIEQLQKFALEDQALVDYIRCHHLIPPSRKPYLWHLRYPFLSEFNSEIKGLFDDEDAGFFIECSTTEGDFISNTLALERDQGWTGLLIVSNPQLHTELMEANRKAWVSDVCLSTDNTVSEANTNIRNFKSSGPVPCFPLILLLKALKVNHVDYFNLDVQGEEFKILQTLPFDDQIKIDVVQVEFEVVPHNKTLLTKFMTSKGYKIFKNEARTIIFNSEY